MGWNLRADRWVFSAGVAAFAAMVPACGPPNDPRPNVVLITLDTFRADRLGAPGNAVDLPAETLEEMRELGYIR